MLRVLSIGREPRGPFAELEARYLERIARFVRCERVVLPASRKRSARERRADEAARLERALDRRGLRIALDARGEPLASSAWTVQLDRWRSRGPVQLIIGGADGLDPALVDTADRKISLGPITLPHELAAVVLLEQLYRALADKQGHPYAAH